MPRQTGKTVACLFSFFNDMLKRMGFSEKERQKILNELYDAMNGDLLLI